MFFVCGWEVFLEFPFRTSKCPPPRWRMTAFVPQKIQKFKTFPTSLETDMPSNSWEMK